MRFIPPRSIILLFVTTAILSCTPTSSPSQTSFAQDPLSSSYTTLQSNEESKNDSLDVQPTPLSPQKKNYDFNAPNSTIKLPKDLKEISGLDVLDDAHLVAIQDEKGKIFSIRMSDGEIQEDKRFGKDGDYEGIEVVDDLLYVLRSDGDVYRIRDWPSSDVDAKKYETFLGTKHDTEGLAYDEKNNRLLIACKESPGSGLKNSRAVYAFDLDSKELIENPVLVIDLKQLEDLTPDNPLNKLIRNLAAPVADLSGFKPAALAIHPITEQIFVISSVRKILLAYNEAGTLEDLWILPEDLFRQPEGLAFLPNGDLFIANEGGNGRATLMRFNYH